MRLKTISTYLKPLMISLKRYRLLEQRLISFELKIKEVVESVNEGLDSLSELQRDRVITKRKVPEQRNREEQRLEDEREKESDKILQRGLSVIAVLAIFSALNDGFAFFRDISWSNLDLLQKVTVGFVYVVCAVAIFYLIKNLVKASKISKENHQLKKK